MNKKDYMLKFFEEYINDLGKYDLNKYHDDFFRKVDKETAYTAMLDEFEKLKEVLKQVRDDFSSDKDVIKKSIQASDKLLDSLSTFCSFHYESFDIVDDCFSELEYHIKNISEDLQNDKEFLIEVLQEYPYVFEFLNENLWNDKEIVKVTFEKNPSVVDGLQGEDISKDKEFLLELAKENNLVFTITDSSLGEDRDFILKAVKLDGDFIMIASDELKNDREIALYSLESSAGNSFPDIGDSLRDDKEIVLKAIEYNERNVIFIGENLKKDKDFMFDILKDIELEYAFETIALNDNLSNDERFLNLLIDKFNEYEAALDYDLDSIKSNDSQKILGILEGYVNNGFVDKFGEKKPEFVDTTENESNNIEL